MIAGLPYDAEVEYLESTGTQWIDTRVIPTVHTGIETDIAITYAPYDLGAISGMCGSGLFAGGGSYSQYIYRSTTDTMTAYTWAFGSIGSFSISIPYGTRTVFGHNFLEDGVVRFDGVQKATLPSNPTLLQYPIALMKLNVANNTSDMRFYVKGRLYHVRISDGSIISHNFVPVRFTNSNGQPEGAMYDRVSRKLFRNAGTGAFTIGPDVATPVMGLHFMPRPKYTARDYVQNGLVAMWDGIENAGWGLHDPNATVWKDLVGNGHDGTFLETPTWYENALHSKTQDGWCNVGKVLSGLTDITIEVVVSGWDTESYRWAFNDVSRGDSYGVQRYDVVKTVLFKAAGTRSYKNNLTAVTNTVALGVYASSTGVAAGRANSEQFASFSFDPTKIEENTSKDYAIGQGNDYGDYHSVRIYRKVLTPGEIAHNYAVDKERFNLP